jgi:nucleotide-binding universal stress UspA family protein
MYDTIVVPLDGSKRAEAIVPHVVELAQCHGAAVVLLHVVEPLPLFAGPEAAYPILDQGEHERRVEQARAYLAAQAQGIQEQGIEARVRVTHGPIVQTIIDVAEQERADLIAMASQGRSGLARVFYGSVAAGVLQRIDRPLLLIRSEASD